MEKGLERELYSRGGCMATRIISVLPSPLRPFFSLLFRSRCGKEKMDRGRGEKGKKCKKYITQLTCPPPPVGLLPFPLPLPPQRRTQHIPPSSPFLPLSLSSSLPCTAVCTAARPKGPLTSKSRRLPYSGGISIWNLPLYGLKLV